MMIRLLTFLVFLGGCTHYGEVDERCFPDGTCKGKLVCYMEYDRTHHTCVVPNAK